MKNKYICVLIKISKRLIWYFVPVIYFNAMWMVRLTMAVCCINLFQCICIDNKICYFLDTMTSCHLKRFSYPVRFHFQGGFSFLTLLRRAAGGCGPVAPPIDHLRNRAWPRTASSLSCLSIIRKTSTTVRFTYISSACCVC